MAVAAPEIRALAVLAMWSAFCHLRFDHCRYSYWSIPTDSGAPSEYSRCIAAWAVTRVRYASFIAVALASASERSRSIFRAVSPSSFTHAAPAGPAHTGANCETPI